MAQFPARTGAWDAYKTMSVLLVCAWIGAENTHATKTATIKNVGEKQFDFVKVCLQQSESPVHV
jgi:hypothetical protein